MRALDLPKDIHEVVILADSNAAAERAARDWLREGRHRPPRNPVFNDLLLSPAAQGHRKVNSDRLSENQRFIADIDNAVEELRDSSMVQPAEKPIITSEAPAPTSIEITVFEKSEGVLSETITAALNGSPVSDRSACRMLSAEAKRTPFPNVGAASCRS